MGDDDPLERQLEQNTEGRERPLLVPGRRPHTELAARSCQTVCKDERALFGSQSGVSLRPRPS